jgi:hypothetical protein
VNHTQILARAQSNQPRHTSLNEGTVAFTHPEEDEADDLSFEEKESNET